MMFKQSLNGKTTNGAAGDAGSADANVLISADNCALGWEGNAVVRGLSFAVRGGDYLCITGENGSGKSTLVQGLLGLKPPMEGRLDRGGVLPGRTGYLPQRRTGMKNFPAGVWEVVISGCLARRALPFYTKADKALALANLERLKAADLRSRCYGELSGGQQQRVLLARALCAAGGKPTGEGHKRPPGLLVLDEPAAGLDPVVSADLYAVLDDLNDHGRGLTVVMVSHDAARVNSFGGAILHLSGGRQAFFGTAADFRASPHGRAFLGAA